MTEPLDLAALNDAAGGLEPDDPIAIGSTYGRTDWDNARRLALYEARDLRYVNDIDAWYHWCDTNWCEASRGDQLAATARVAMQIQREAALIEDEDERARHMAHAQSSLSERALRAMIGVGIAVDELRTSGTFDRLTDWINLPNCTLNVRTLDWHPHRREDMLTQLCPTSWVPTAQSKRFDDFLDQFIPDKEEREYILQVLAASTLIGHNDARRMVLLIGPTSTGKSTLMDLVTRTMGSAYAASVNSSIFRGNLDDKPRPDLLRIRKTRLVTASEANDRWELHGDQIKRMTGGDPLSARAMRSDIMHEFVASYTPFIIANVPPSIHDADEALRRRLAVLTMDVTVSEADDDAGAARRALVTDEDAQRTLLARLVQTFHECDGRVVAPMPTRFAEATMELFAGLDDIDSIMRSLVGEGSLYRADVTANHCITTSMLYKCYTTWLHRHGTHQQKREQLKERAFSARLRSLGYEIKESHGMRVVGWCVGDTNTTNTARF